MEPPSELDVVEEAERESFPASDPPSWTLGRDPIVTRPKPDACDEAANGFAVDDDAMERDARAQLGAGVVTESYGADPEQVAAALNQALATQLVSMLRYRAHHYAAKGVHSPAVAREFLCHSNDELRHADRIAARIAQLGGVARFDPDDLLAHSHTRYRSPPALEDMVRENLVAERMAIETYARLVRWLGDDDPTSRRLIEDVLRTEEEHASELLELSPSLEHSSLGR